LRVGYNSLKRTCLSRQRQYTYEQGNSKSNHRQFS
jgi:hypothetical protein